ncbi:MAG: amidohydrolase, partial [Sphingobacteriales bacterium]
MKFRMLLWSLLLLSFCASAQQTPKNFNEIIQQTESDLIKWRRHFHEFPELSNRETNTGKYIADYL